MAKKKHEKEAEVVEAEVTQTEVKETSWDAFWESYKKQNPERAARLEEDGEISKQKASFK